MDIEHTILLMTMRPRMFVLNSSGMYHFLSGILSEKRDNDALKGNEILLPQCFLSWKKDLLKVDAPSEVFSFYDNLVAEDGLISMAQDLLHVYKEVLPFYKAP